MDIVNMDIVNMDIANMDVINMDVINIDIISVDIISDVITADIFNSYLHHQQLHRQHRHQQLALQLFLSVRYAIRFSGGHCFTVDVTCVASHALLVCAEPHFASTLFPCIRMCGTRFGSHR